MFLQDLIKRKYNITGFNGERLPGSKPYDHDATVPEQIAVTWTLVEVSECRWLILLGTKNLMEFQQMYGKLEETGQEFDIGGRPVKVYVSVFQCQYL